MVVKSQEIRAVKIEDDIALLRSSVKRIVALLNFSLVNQTKIITATSELARNTLEHGLGGNAVIQLIEDPERVGIKLTFQDEGPGISDINKAMEDGYSTGKGMGLGLAGAKRLMDEFEIESKPSGGHQGINRKVARESIDVVRGALLQVCALKTEDDLVDARAAIKLHSVDLGFSKINQTKIVTAASELGRNVLEHGLGGSLQIDKVFVEGKNGIRLIFQDQGPGIVDLELALTDGYTSKKGLGLGLTGSKRLMDEFSIDTTPGIGTKVTVTKWT